MAQINPPVVQTDSAPTASLAALRKRRRFGLFTAGSGALLFGLLLLRILGPKPVPPPKVVHYTPQQAADAQKSMDTLRAQLLTRLSVPSTPADPQTPGSSAAKRPLNTPNSVPASGPSPVHVQLSQSDLNTYLATDPQVKALLTSRGVQAVQLLLREPHNVICRAAVLYKGRPTNVQITGSLLPSPDTVARFEATSAQVGALPLPPGVVTSQASRIADQFTGRMRGRFPITVQDIRVIGDHLVLTGVRRLPSKG